MRKRTPITFQDKSFCFTGKMAELLRKDAEREVRARGGLSQGGVNRNLDYLVVGDIPSAAWKFGDYGSKIMSAMEYKAQGKRKPRIVSESDFLEDLATSSPTNTGAIDTKVIVCSYFINLNEAEAAQGFNPLVDELSSIEDSHVKVKMYPADCYGTIFADEGAVTGSDGWDVRVRITKVAGLDYMTGPFVEAVATALTMRFGDGGHLTWTEKAEGSADFVKYLRELPKAQRVQILAYDG